MVDNVSDTLGANETAGLARDVAVAVACTVLGSISSLDDDELVIAGTGSFTSEPMGASAAGKAIGDRR